MDLLRNPAAVTCYHPLEAYKNPTGGRPFFNPPRDHAPIPLKLSCGQCLGCRIQREVTWSIRMMHEADRHDENHFVTLTYDHEHLPADNSLDHSHFQKFIRSLRKRTGQKIRFFMAGEYGEETSRPHYHAILFGLQLSDLEVWGQSGRNTLHQSAFLNDVWGHGAALVGDRVTRQACVYTAGYLLKDVNKEWLNDWEWPDFITGELHPRKKPYCRMSNRPGIGKIWYDLYSSDVFPGDFVVMDGKKYPSPAYYRRLLEKQKPELAEKLKAKRQDAIRAPEFRKNSTPERLAVREICLSLIAGNKAERSSRQRGMTIGRGKYANSDQSGATANDLAAQARRMKL